MIADDIPGPTITLVILDSERVTERYVNWMNDIHITQYLESRFAPVTLEQLRDFVESMRQSTDNYFFAILDTATGEHIGNIKVGPINRHHLRAPIGLVVGEPSAWGKGVATTAIRMISQWAFSDLGLHKLVAGAYAANRGSIRAFEKAGFRLEGHHMSDVVLVDGTRADAVTLGLTVDDFVSAQA